MKKFVYKISTTPPPMIEQECNYCGTIYEAHMKDILCGECWDKLLQAQDEYYQTGVYILPDIKKKENK